MNIERIIPSLMPTPVQQASFDGYSGFIREPWKRNTIQIDGKVKVMSKEDRVNKYEVDCLYSDEVLIETYAKPILVLSNQIRFISRDRFINNGP